MKNTLLSYWQVALGYKKCSIITDHADYKILKSWFNSTPIKNSEGWQGTYKKAECSLQQTFPKGKKTVLSTQP